MEVAAATAGFISLSIQITQTLLNFYSAYRSQKSDIIYTIKKLDHLLGVLEALSSQLRNRKFRADEQTLLESIYSSIQNCEGWIEELQGETEKIKGESRPGISAAARTAACRATYPFRQSTLQKLDEDIDEIVSHLSLALQLLELKDISYVQDDLKDTNALLDLVRADQISSAIKGWLNAPDVTREYYRLAYEKWHPGTGLWFVKGAPFSAWLANRQSFLWLNGFAGCGKSVLCSTAIRYTYRHQRSNPRAGVAFFLFDFTDDSKQDTSAMLRALVLQLSSQLNDNHSHLSRLHAGYRNATPPNQALFDCLRQLVRAFDDVYILLDALDESPRDSHRGSVLQTLTDLRAWRESGLHILVTSRDETDIRDELDAAQHEDISLENDAVDRDIASFISQHLRDNRRLRKWEEHYDRIEAALTERAKGVFRWVECQFAALESCPRSKRRLDKLLASLPRSLDKTYERMLLNIDEESVPDARRILNLLCCAKRPLTVSELIEGIAVELGDNPRLNLDGRLLDEEEIHRVCPGLIKVDVDARRNSATVRIAHFSVQEYLESDRMHNAVAAFRVRRAEVHAEIASVCLTYLLDPGLSATGDSTKYPFASYAAESWHKHYHDADGSLYRVEPQALRLFQQNGGAFETWIRIIDPSFDLTNRPLPLCESVLLLPVYFASLLGLESVLSVLLSKSSSKCGLPKADSSEFCFDINTQSGRDGNALQAASVGGHEAIVQLLLAKGADINAQGGRYGNALQAASWAGHKAIVQLLLEKGANINAQSGHYGNALQAASWGGHEAIVQLLLAKGAEVNAQVGRYGNALQAASWAGHKAIVQLLLEKGANINAQSGDYGNALQAASWDGHEAIVQLLLEKGADINAQGGTYGNALQAASDRGHKAIVQLLLEKGADINAQGGSYGNTLQAASWGGHEAIVQLLLAKGADINAQGGRYGNALQAASDHGHEAIVQLLLEKGADINAQGGSYGNALQAASWGGHEAIVQLLLEKGADINAQGGRYGNALQAASLGGHEAIVQLLLKKGADVNAQNGSYGNALQAALVSGHEAIVQLLLEKGADINAQGGSFGNALQAASWGGCEAIVQLLLEKGADVNAQGGRYGNALQAASLGGHEAIVQLLLKKGADVNAQGGDYGNALQVASLRCHEAIVQLLLEKGAEVNVQGGRFGNALQAASWGGCEAIVQLLLEKGADINAQGGRYGNALQAASLGGHEAIIQLLLEQGADINAQVGRYGNALQAASLGGHKAIVQLLLEKGADVNAQGGEYKNPLQAASLGGHKAVVQLLLEKGADINVQGRDYGNALQAASVILEERILQILL